MLTIISGHCFYSSYRKRRVTSCIVICKVPSIKKGWSPLKWTKSSQTKAHDYCNILYAIPFDVDIQLLNQSLFNLRAKIGFFFVSHVY